MSNIQRITILVVCATVLMACSKPESSVTAGNAAAPSAVQSPSLVMPSVVPVPVAPVAPEHVAGKQIFDKTCGLCHGAGTGGAPRPGDKANWAPRIAQGMDVLYEHARVGYNGAYGYMPPRGGAGATDPEIKAGVDYMVYLSR